MKLFTKDIDKKLFAQYPLGGGLSNQKVIAKIFNPYGRGVWYILNSDPEDPDYLWAIVNLFEVEVGSVSRQELESIRLTPFKLPLERDLYFTPINAQELYDGLLEGKHYGKGGELEKGIAKEMHEHGMSRKEAEKTALDHLRENPHYYSLMEKYKLEEGGKLSDSNYLVKMAEEYSQSEYEKPVKKGEGFVVMTKNGDSLDYKEVTVFFKDGTTKTFYKEDFHKFFDTYAQGGFVPRLVKKDEYNVYYKRFENAIGSFAWIYEKKYHEGILYPFDEYDREYYSHLNLKEGEALFRYKTEKMTRFEGERLVKINMEKGLVYFLSDVEDDKNPKFETKGIKLSYLAIDEVYFDLGMYKEGGVTFDDKVRAVKKTLLNKKVPSKYRNLYGKTYDKQESEEAAKRIIGAQVKKYKKK